MRSNIVGAAKIIDHTFIDPSLQFDSTDCVLVGVIQKAKNPAFDRQTLTLQNPGGTDEVLDAFVFEQAGNQNEYGVLAYRRGRRREVS